MRQWQRAALASAMFLAALTASLYVGREPEELGFQLIPLEFAAAVAAGWVIGRWWALLLALTVTPLLVVAPFADETDSDGTTLETLAFFAGPLLSLWPLLGLAIGVAAPKIRRRRRATA